MPSLLESNPANIKLAASAIRNGRVVAFPTETVYGLGADAFNEDAVNRIFEMKGRPNDNPLIVHATSIDFIRSKVVAAHAWDERCELLANSFWPGPLTLILPKRDAVPCSTTAGRPTVAIRWPRHPVAQSLIQESGCAIAAPSANISSHISPTAASHVMHDFARVTDLMILNGGPCELGLESTVFDLTNEKVAVVLRPGSVTPAMLKVVLESVDCEIREQAEHSQSASPGTRSSHYAPRTPTTLIPHRKIADAIVNAQGSMVLLARESYEIESPTHPPRERSFVQLMPRQAADYAARLYDALRWADSQGCDQIVIEEPPRDSELWLAVHDRLKRATNR